jgi:hypothetical protein
VRRRPPEAGWLPTNRELARLAAQYFVALAAALLMALGYWPTRAARAMAAWAEEEA